MLCAHDKHTCWDCRVAEAKAAGGEVHTPNGLPIGCIRANGTMLEHEHGDHPDYKFPVEIERGAPVPAWSEESRQILLDAGFEADSDLDYPETHAFIYTDGSVVVTLYECCYAMFSLRTGELLGGEYEVKTARLSEESRKKISAFCK